MESLKLFGVIKGWELPEDLFYSLHDDWVSELKDVGRDDEYVDEVNDEVLNLHFVDTDAKHVSKFQIFEHIIMEEQWENVLKVHSFIETSSIFVYFVHGETFESIWEFLRTCICGEIHQE